MKKRVFSPGCALILYKPELAEKLHKMLIQYFGPINVLSTCCHHDPQFLTPTEVINICPGCDKRFGNNYNNSTTVSLWEILAENKSFPFPDYKGEKMTILDACPTRENDKAHAAIRILLNKMNISLVEPEKNRRKSTCCGDSFYGVIPTEKVLEQMQKKANEMPEENVVVYCVSCIKSMFNGEKNPRYLIDLLFQEETLPKTLDPDEWHNELNLYIENH